LNKREAFNSHLPTNFNHIYTSAPHRIFVSPENISQDRIILRGELLKKVRLVLRLKPKDPLSVFDGTGFEYLAQIVSLTPHAGELKIMEKTHPPRESPLKIHLGQAVPKSQMDFIIQKSVRLGVGESPFFPPDHTSFKIAPGNEKDWTVAKEYVKKRIKVQPCPFPTGKYLGCLSTLLINLTGVLRFITAKKNPSHRPLKFFRHQPK